MGHLLVRNLAKAVRWYTHALGAENMWDSRARAILVLGRHYFWVWEGRTAGSSDRMQVFVADPDGLVARAAASGAAVVDKVRDHEAPWGIQRRGSFVDPFGHTWLVSDESPRSAYGPGRVNHMDYIHAVADDLAVLGIRIGFVGDRSTDTPYGPPRPGTGPEPERTQYIVDKSSGYGLGEVYEDDDLPKRAAYIYIDNWDAWPWHEYCVIYAELRWDEEYGWVMTRTDELNAGIGRGRWESRYGLGLGLVSEPAEVALCVERMFNTSGSLPFDKPRLLRQAAADNPELEAALTAYLARQ